MKTQDRTIRSRVRSQDLILRMLIHVEVGRHTRRERGSPSTSYHRGISSTNRGMLWMHGGK